MSPQLKKLVEHLKANDLSFAYISQPQSIAYLTQFESDPHERVLGLAVFPESNPFLFTPGLDAQDARDSGWTFDIYSYQDHENPWQIIADQIKARANVDNGAFEKDHLTVKRYEQLKEVGIGEGADLTSVMQNMMVAKTEDELEKMKIAGEWADKAIKVGFASLKEGITETEVVAEIEYQLKKLGNEGMSFTTIVLFGDHAASPHGVPGDRKLQKNEFVLFDLGCVYKGYTSDTSRTVAFGQPNQKAREIYDVVLQAQLKATEAVRPGVTAGEIDRVARTVIEEAGYGEYFTHRLGHGIGKSIHEFPDIMEGNDLILEEGMCFSIEPGIYIPNVVGVRIEDCIFVTKDGSEPFTHVPKEYTELSV